MRRGNVLSEHTWYVIVSTDPLRPNVPVSSFPSKDGRALPLIQGYFAYNFWVAALSLPPIALGLMEPVVICRILLTSVGHLHEKVDRKPHY